MGGPQLVPVGPLEGFVTWHCPPKVKTHLQAQTLSAMVVGHQHNHEVSGYRVGVGGHRGFGGTLSLHAPGGTMLFWSAGI